MIEKKLRFKYILSDFITAATGWTLFFIFRKLYIEAYKFGHPIPINFDKKYFLGLVIVPLFWIFLYYLSGYYKEVLRKSRFEEFILTLISIIIGSIILFFTIILDDIIASYKNYYTSFFFLFLSHFTITYIPRLIITTQIVHKIHRRQLGLNTLIIGANGKAEEIYIEIKNLPKGTGNNFVGFLSIDNNNSNNYKLNKYLPYLGNLDNIHEVIEKYNIKEIIIAIENTEHNKIENIINKLIGIDVNIKAIPNMYDILTGKVKMRSILDVPLIQISHELMPAWQENLKYTIDKIIALIALIISAPISIILAIAIKLDSRGPIIYSHERIGRYGKPFNIYKFRSMYIDAEKNGPKLSSKNDNRVTRIGKFMRKMRLDEIPNFINVLKGDMSLVGPRPERKYYIDQIIQKAPHYLHLLKVKPGITSWGQVKYGYAENVDQMIERLKYDLIYLDNMSLLVDFKIMLHTIITIIKGKGV